MSKQIPARAKPPEFGYNEDSIEVHLGKRIRALREHHLMYRTTTARACTFSARQLARFEQGKAFPRINELVQLANLFRVSILYFVMDAPAPYNVETIGQRFAAGHTAWK